MLRLLLLALTANLDSAFDGRQQATTTLLHTIQAAGYSYLLMGLRWSINREMCWNHCSCTCDDRQLAGEALRFVDIHTGPFSTPASFGPTWANFILLPVTWRRIAARRLGKRGSSGDLKTCHHQHKDPWRVLMCNCNIASADPTRPLALWGTLLRQRFSFEKLHEAPGEISSTNLHRKRCRYRLEASPTGQSRASNSRSSRLGTPMQGTGNFARVGDLQLIICLKSLRQPECFPQGDVRRCFFKPEDRVSLGRRCCVLSGGVERTAYVL